ncbi:MAG: GGDEF domain-containing protein [Candidatus Omnitrophica bacterium]|nr:GGDEF domain-containing protein [Candidatus Omnitrophota bacterium]
MAKTVIVERFLFLLVLFIGIILSFHTALVKITQDMFFVDYLTASSASGVILLTALYMIAKFNKGLEKQIGNFLYFKGKHHYKVLLREAITDGLTDLYDHKYLMLKLEEEMDRSKRYSRPLSILMMDIDHFKAYNDSFGHPAGDEVLIKLAEILRKAARKADTVARYGGEEFVAILPETRKEDAIIMAERLKADVGNTRFEDYGRITISVGVGLFDGEDKNLTKEAFIKMADDALYRAKKNGRTRVEA